MSSANSFLHQMGMEENSNRNKTLKIAISIRKLIMIGIIIFSLIGVVLISLVVIILNQKTDAKNHEDISQPCNTDKLIEIYKMLSKL